MALKPVEGPFHGLRYGLAEHFWLLWACILGITGWASHWGPGFPPTCTPVCKYPWKILV